MSDVNVNILLIFFALNLSFVCIVVGNKMQCLRDANVSAQGEDPMIRNSLSYLFVWGENSELRKRVFLGYSSSSKIY